MSGWLWTLLVFLCTVASTISLSHISVWWLRRCWHKFIQLQCICYLYTVDIRWRVHRGWWSLLPRRSLLVCRVSMSTSWSAVRHADQSTLLYHMLPCRLRRLLQRLRTNHRRRTASCGTRRPEMARQLFPVRGLRPAAGRTRVFADRRRTSLL